MGAVKLFLISVGWNVECEGQSLCLKWILQWFYFLSIGLTVSVFGLTSFINCLHIPRPQVLIIHKDHWRNKRFVTVSVLFSNTLKQMEVLDYFISSSQKQLEIIQSLTYRPDTITPNTAVIRTVPPWDCYLWFLINLKEKSGFFKFKTEEA